VSDAGPLTLGTAGHIDHGKTALVRALTGVETDRLPAERARGISIELGYAALELPSGRRLSLVDAPGHERFVRTMVAGASGIDAYVMTIAADDGVMPQTREHAAVLAGLGVREGVVAVTKADLADPAASLAAARELLPGVEAVAVSARTGAGVHDLREALERLARRVRSRAAGPGPVRLHVDRVFTIRGAGTVVTGTLWAGSLGRGDELVIQPAGRRARVRNTHVHDRPVARAAAGQRVAVNLTGVSVSDVSRGDVLTSPDAGVSPSFVLDVALELAAGAEMPGHAERVQAHHGTRETPARLAWLGGRFWQVRGERPLMAMAGDRLIVRRIAPPGTLGGAVVLDPAARKHGPSSQGTARLTRLLRGQPADPEPPAPPAAAPAPPAPPPPQPLSASALALHERLRAARFEPPPETTLGPTAAQDLAALREAGRVVRVGRALHYDVEALAAAQRLLVGLIEAEGAATLARYRDELDSGRRHAQALLEHFDGERLTLRRPDDTRVLRRRDARRGGRT
jgi:selenocysteine-specific elongation factor